MTGFSGNLGGGRGHGQIPEFRKMLADMGGKSFSEEVTILAASEEFVEFLPGRTSWRWGIILLYLI